VLLVQRALTPIRSTGKPKDYYAIGYCDIADPAEIENAW
jgi:hypothetical protein